jgi:serine/threonine protein kinase
MVLHHARTAPIPPSHVSELPIPGELESLLMRCLEKDPSSRPSSALELESELSRVALDQPWTQEKAREWWDRHAPDTLREVQI